MFNRLSEKELSIHVKNFKIDFLVCMKKTKEEWISLLTGGNTRPRDTTNYKKNYYINSLEVFKQEVLLMKTKYINNTEMLSTDFLNGCQQINYSIGKYILPNNLLSDERLFTTPYYKEVFKAVSFELSRIRQAETFKKNLKDSHLQKENDKLNLRVSNLEKDKDEISKENEALWERVYNIEIFIKMRLKKKMINLIKDYQP